MFAVPNHHNKQRDTYQKQRGLRPVFPKVLVAMPFLGVNSLAACLTTGFWGALRKVHCDDAGGRARVSSVSGWRRERAEKWAEEAPKPFEGLNNRLRLKRASKICAQKGVGFTRIVLSLRSLNAFVVARPAARRTVVDGLIIAAADRVEPPKVGGGGKPRLRATSSGGGDGL